MIDVDLTALQAAVARLDVAEHAASAARKARDEEIQRLPQRLGLQMLICEETGLCREQVRRIRKGNIRNGNVTQ